MITLLGLVTGIGGGRIIQGRRMPEREATLALYHEGFEVGSVNIDMASPEIGDKFDITIKKQEATP
jgi:hypothetical protein